jgi:HK97 gp10 family phage protein
MSVVQVKGLTTLNARLAAASQMEGVKTTLRQEAEAIGDEARRAAPGELGATVEIIDQSRETKTAYAIGTAHRAGRFLEFGTVRRPATPWLWPAFRARSPGIKHKLRNIIHAAFKSRRGEV